MRPRGTSRFRHPGRVDLVRFVRRVGNDLRRNGDVVFGIDGHIDVRLPGLAGYRSPGKFGFGHWFGSARMVVCGSRISYEQGGTLRSSRSVLVLSAGPRGRRVPLVVGRSVLRVRRCPLSLSSARFVLNDGNRSTDRARLIDLRY